MSVECNLFHRKMDESFGHRRVQEYSKGLCGQTVSDSACGGFDSCEPVGARYIVPMLYEKQSCLLRQEISGCHPEGKLRRYGHLW